MAPPYKIRVVISAIEGQRCPLEHRVGQEWELDRTTPGGMCPSAYNTIFSAWQIFRYGGNPPGARGSDVANRSCPDPNGKVLFELTRLRDD